MSNSYSKVCQTMNNKVLHANNGNISKKGNFSLFSWNKGNSLFSNKRDYILVTLDRYHPELFALHEADYNNKVDKGFKNYSI